MDVTNLLALKEARILAIIQSRAKANIGGKMAITMGLAEAKNNFSRVTAEVNRTGRPVTVMKNNKPWVIINPASSNNVVGLNAVDVAVDFMDEYADVFTELAK